MKTVIYSDGSSSPHFGNAGGWGSVVLLNGTVFKELYGFEKPSTNQRMELMAVIKGLEFILANDLISEVEVISDSQYMIKGCTIWYYSWIRRGWKTADGSEVKNRDLWAKLISLVGKVPNIKFTWVKGHSGNYYNEMADRLAGNAGRNQVSSK